MTTSHEQQFVASFLAGRHKARWAGMLNNSGGRSKFLETLHHGTHALDMRFAEIIPNNFSASDILDRLNKLGAPQSCYVFSTMPEIDGQTIALHDAIIAMLGSQMGSVASCQPGELAYWESEDPGWRYICVRPKRGMKQ